MVKKIDDFDLEDDIPVETSKGKTEKVKNPVKKAFDFLKKKKADPEVEFTPEDSWEECLRRMNEHCEHTWICRTHIDGETLKLQIVDLEDCDGETFFHWVEDIYPQAKNSKHSPDNYDTLENREITFEYVREVLEAIRKYWPPMDLTKV